MVIPTHIDMYDLEAVGMSYELGKRREGQGYHLWLVMLMRRAQRASHVCITGLRW